MVNELPYTNWQGEERTAYLTGFTGDMGMGFTDPRWHHGQPEHSTETLQVLNEYGERREVKVKTCSDIFKNEILFEFEQHDGGQDHKRHLHTGNNFQHLAWGGGKKRMKIKPTDRQSRSISMYFEDIN